jgi:hypothetical protein
LFFANPSSVFVLHLNPAEVVTQKFAVGFQFISGMILDSSDRTNEVL